jgi:hypothetical protein
MVLEETPPSHPKEPETILGRRWNVAHASPGDGEDVCHQISHLRSLRWHPSADIAEYGLVMFEIETFELCLSLCLG